MSFTSVNFLYSYMILKIVFSVLFIGSWVLSQAQPLRNRKEGGYQFTPIQLAEALPVDDQYRTSTCWSFSALSFFEAELKRMGRSVVNLSEMWVVRHTYSDKAKRYVRMHGDQAFSPGGAFHDAIHVMKTHGLVPQSAYLGKSYGEEKHKHSELDEVLKATVDVIVKSPNGRVSTAWPAAVDGILDAYLGEAPTSFSVDGKSFTPKEYASACGLKGEDYIEITSFTHHPPYQSFVLEVPDNWNQGQVYNLPLDEMITCVNYALKNGYTLAWGTDVSEKGFAFKQGIAVVPDQDLSQLGKRELDSILNNPVKEMVITPEVRQLAFDNYETQDDHGMHIIGIVKDQRGEIFYLVKNSWGKESNECDGYLYVSEAYLKYKTTSLMVHKDGLPKSTVKQLGL